jgi:gluconate transporter
MLLLHLAVAIAFILIIILVLKWSPVIALIIGSLYIGFVAHLGMPETIAAITSGFGDLMAGIGLPIGFGIILGQLLSDSGGARSIAVSIVQKFPRERAIYGMGMAAFILSIPVFYDVTFVILVPIGLALTRETKKPLPYVIAALVVGAAAAHTFVPPTPNPLAAPSILGFDLGTMLIMGLIVGFAASILAMKLLFFLLDKGLWSREKDEMAGMAVTQSPMPANAPSALVAMIPILLPVFLILLGTSFEAFTHDVPRWVSFLSNKVTALLCGTMAAYLIVFRRITGKALEQSVAQAMSSAGIVLLVTGAGGSFGAVIKATGIGNALVAGISNSAYSAVWAVLVAYFLAMIFRVSQGSGTVASITTMTIVAGADMAATTGLHPVWLALAALSGGISIGHINDSGFWVTANLGGLTITGGLKTYTLGEFFVSVIVLLITILAVLFIPAF